MELPLDTFAPLATERLAIRPLEAADAEALHLLTDDPVITRRIIFLPASFTLADARALIGQNDRENAFLGVWQEAALVGVVGTHLRGSDRVEIGYWFGPAFHGRGYATEAASAVIARLRALYSSRQIIAQCKPENSPSWNLLHKLGFRPTGDQGQWPDRALLVLPHA